MVWNSDMLVDFPIPADGCCSWSPSSIPSHSSKVSLVLSLGLVGALSIIRFRTAIKEPEQIVYLFLLISISISVGAGHLLVSIIIVLISRIIAHFMSISNDDVFSENNYCKIVFSSQLSLNKKNDLFELIESSKHIKKIIRYVNDNESAEITFNINFPSLKEFNLFQDKLIKIDKNFSISYIASN